MQAILSMLVRGLAHTYFFPLKAKTTLSGQGYGFW